MSTKSIAFWSTGIPDPTQGGSGVFNYYVIKTLLEKGYQVDGYFRAGENFLLENTVGIYLQELINNGLKCNIINNEYPRRRLIFGRALLFQSHQVKVCTEAVDNVSKSGKKYDAHIAHDFGWIIALAGRFTPVVGIVGDPLPNRLYHGHDWVWKSPRTWLVRLQSLSTGNRWIVKKIANKLNGKVIMGSFTPLHAEEYRSKGLDCRHFRWFSPEVTTWASVRAEKKNDGIFRMLHVGTLDSTASNKMLTYWKQHLLPELAKLPFSIEIRFVGRGNQPLCSKWQNIRLISLGYEKSLDDEFLKCNVFFSPMQYPVGTRTRILTAMSYGVPTIADPSASLGLPELVSGRDIFYGRDPATIKSVIQTLYENQKLADKVGESARKKWEKLFNPKINVDKILKVIGV